MRKNTVALFDDRLHADQAVEDLVWEGFERHYIRVLPAEGEAEVFREQIEASGSFVGEGAATGLIWGAILGGLIGWAIGYGLINSPAATGHGFQGLLAGAVTGGLLGGGIGIAMGFGVPAKDADLYEQHAVRNQTLVVVESAESSVPMVRNFLESRGAHDLRVMEVLTTPAPMGTIPYDTEPRQTTSHAYADNAPGNQVPTGDTTEVANTMGGARPRYGSLDEDENRTVRE